MVGGAWRISTAVIDVVVVVIAAAAAVTEHR
jgi:hypothetical protein